MNTKLIIKAHFIQKKLGLLIFIFLLNSCNNNFFLDNGSSTSVHHSYPQTSNASIQSDNMSATFKVNALALAQDIGPELKQNLMLSGLTEEQSNIVVEHAKEELVTHVSAISLPDTSFLLTENQVDEFDPILLAGPFMAGGAINALGLEKLGVDDTVIKVNLTSTIIDSSFTSLQGRTTHLQEESYTTLSSKMSSEAVKNIDSAGIGNSLAGEATYAITSGAIGALSKSGAPSEYLAPVANSIVKGTVSELSKLSWNESDSSFSEQITNAISKATEGAVSKVSSINLDDEGSLSLVGELSSSTVESLNVLKSSGLNLNISSTIKSISKGAVSGLKKSSMTDSKLGPALESITSSMVSSLDKSGAETSELSDSVGAIASGAISGLSLTGLNGSELSDGSAIEKVMIGTTKNLSKINLSDADKATSIGNLVNQAVVSLSDTNFEESNKENAINAILDGTMNNLINAGISGKSLVQIAAKEATKGAAKALSKAGFKTENMTNITGKIVKRSISLMIKNGNASTSDDLKTATKELAQGAVEGFGSLMEENSSSNLNLSTAISDVLSEAIDAVSTANTSNNLNLSTSDIGDISLEVASGSVEAAAIIGTSPELLSSFEQSVITNVVSNLRDIGLDESELTYIETQVESSFDSAQELATKIQQGSSAYSKCSELYPATSSDTDIVNSVRDLPNPILCIIGQNETCPLPRKTKDMSIDWVISDINLDLNSDQNICQLRRIFLEEVYPLPFEILTTSDSITKENQTITWSQSSGATSYAVRITSDKECINIIQRHVVTTNDFTLQNISLDRDYFVCVNARNDLGKITRALNNSLHIFIDSTDQTTTPPNSDKIYLEYFDSINLTNHQAYYLYGQCTFEGKEVSITIGTITTTTICSSFSWYTDPIDLSTLTDGNKIPLILKHTDGIDFFESQYELTKDTQPGSLLFSPNIQPSINIQNQLTYKVHGTCSEEGTIFLHTLINGIAETYGETLCINGIWELTKDVAYITDYPIFSIVASLTDQAYNYSPEVTLTVSKDTIVPQGTLDTVPTIDSTNVSSVPISGTCNELSDVIITLAAPELPNPLQIFAACPATLTWSLMHDFSTIPNSPNLEIKVRFKDDAGNISPFINTFTSKNTTLP